LHSPGERFKRVGVSEGLCGCRGLLSISVRLVGVDMEMLLLDNMRTVMMTTKVALDIVAITLAVVAQVQAQLFITNRVVAYYTLNGNADNESGNANNAISYPTFHYRN